MCVEHSYIHRSELDDRQYAAIGRLVRAFSNLEHELAGAAVRLLGAPSFTGRPASSAKLAEEAVKGAFRKRLKIFVQAYTDTCQADAWSQMLKEELGEMCLWRDGVCHGLWVARPDGGLTLTFYDRGSFEKLIAPTPQHISVDDLLKMANTANAWAFELRERIRAEPQN